MKRNNPSPAASRNRETNQRTRASVPGATWQCLGLDEDRSEGFEVVLRLLLVLCVGAAMLTCGTWSDAPARVADQPSAVCVDPAQVAVGAAAALLPKAVGRGIQSFR